MKRTLLPWLALASILGAALPTTALCGKAPELDAASAKTFFNAKGCNACHAVDEYRIGPSYRMVSARYASEGVARAGLLAAKIREGGAGAWGVVPMISNPNLTQDEAESVARWILGLPAQPPPK